MREIEIKIEFITPAFIGGVDNKNISEFRISSLKGLLRFWWRVYQQYNSEEELYKKESQIFGDTDHKSTFSISSVQPLEPIIGSGQSFNLNQEGIKYLFFSMYGSYGRSAWLNPGTTIDLKFRFFKGEYIKDILTSLWWLENFGGIGARSRRGAGSFRIREISGLDGIDGIPKFMYQEKNLSINSIDSFLKDNINIILPCSLSTLPSYTAYRNGFSRFKVLTGYSSWEKAANSIGQILAGYRRSDITNSSAPFHNEAVALHNFATTGNYTGPNTLTKTAFGLPIIYRFRNRNTRTGRPTGLIDEFVEASGEDKTRRGSPLFIKIGCLPNNENYYVVVLCLWSKFLPDEEKVMIKVKRGAHNAKTHSLNQPDKNVIDKFLDSL